MHKEAIGSDEMPFRNTTTTTMTCNVGCLGFESYLFFIYWLAPFGTLCQGVRILKLKKKNLFGAFLK